jgi:hypothetical protein
MEDRWIPKTILTYNPKRRNTGRPPAVKMEAQTKHGLIHEDYDNEASILRHYLYISRRYRIPDL